MDTSEQVKFTSQTYQKIEDGIAVMRTIAEELTITGGDREAKKAAEARAIEAAAARTALLSAKGRLENVDGETRGQFAAAYKNVEAAYLKGEKAFNEGEYEAVQQNIRNMDAALNALAQKKQNAIDSAAAIKKFLGDYRRFLSIGAQAGTWFTAPWIVFSPRFTFSVFPYTFFDIACDVGVLHGYEQKVDYDAKYFSLYPSGHINFFAPFLKKEDKLRGDWYIGAGVAWLYAYYKDDANTYNVSLWAFDATNGFYFGVGHHYFNIAYTFRTDLRMDFERINHKISAGYTFRFY
jgi:hypothetical protein